MKHYIWILGLVLFGFYVGSNCKRLKKEEDRFVNKRPDSIRTYIEHYFNGQKKAEMSIRYSNNIHGIYLTWFDNGQKSSEFKFYGGQLHGKQVTWWRNGQVQSVREYDKGKRHGEKINWRSTGKKISHSYYRYGKLVKKEFIEEDRPDTIMLSYLIQAGMDTSSAKILMQNSQSARIIKTDSGNQVIFDESIP